MKSPFYRVLVAGSGRDLTENITSFTFEDCTDQDDLLRLVLGRIPVSLLDDKDLRNGTRLLFSWGYLGGATSPQQSAVVTSVEPTFDATLNLTLLATHEGLAMKKGAAPQLYQGKTASTIAREMAKKHGLKADVEDTSRVYESLPTAGRTEAELLAYLASQEEGGLFRFAIKGATLHFRRTNLTSPSRRTFTWNDGNGTVISFRPSLNDHHKKAAGGATVVAGMDPFSGKPFKASAVDGEVKGDTKLGTYRTLYNQDANQVGTRRETAPPAAPAPQRNVPLPTSSAAQASDAALSEKKKAAMDDVTASLTVEGDPNLSADGLITMAGVGTLFGGNWYVKKVVHRLQGGSAYTCGLELSRNATDESPSVGAPKNETKNTAPGPDKTTATREVRVYYDENSNQTTPRR